LSSTGWEIGNDPLICNRIINSNFADRRVPKLCRRQPGSRAACIRRMCRLSLVAARRKHDRTKSSRSMEPEGRHIGQFQPLFARDQSADIEWNDKTLDEWIDDPQHLVPGNEMTFAGIKDARQRADLLAFL